MGYLRFFRRKKIGPGLTLNMSKSGPSLSIGPKGAKVTVGRRGVPRTVGIPGTGLYYTSLTKRSRQGSPSMGASSASSWVGAAVIILVVAALVGSCLGGKNQDTGQPAASSGLGLFAPAGTTTPAGVSETASPTAVVTTHPKATAKPKPKATPKPTPKPTPRATKRPTLGVFGNPWGYDFRLGSLIYNPPADFCAYFPCIASFGNSAGYVVQCYDGDFSTAGGRSGACSYHQGVRRALYRH